MIINFVSQYSFHKLFFIIYLFNILNSHFEYLYYLNVILIYYILFIFKGIFFLSAYFIDLIINFFVSTRYTFYYELNFIFIVHLQYIMSINEFEFHMIHDLNLNLIYPLFYNYVFFTLIHNPLQSQLNVKSIRSAKNT